jgi:hypothetical protein
MAAYLPPGWPAGVHPPGSEEFERTAAAWLLDVVPPDYRLYGVLRRHPVALAALARHHLAACVEGARQGYRTARTELGDVLPVPGLDAVLAAYRSEGSRLVATACAVDLVARALRGEVFTPQLRNAPGGQARAGDQPGRRGKAAGQADQPDRSAGRQEHQATGQEQDRAPAAGRQEHQATGQEQDRAPAAGRQEHQATGQEQDQAPAAGRREHPRGKTAGAPERPGKAPGRQAKTSGRQRAR